MDGVDGRGLMWVAAAAAARAEADAGRAAATWAGAHAPHEPHAAGAGAAAAAALGGDDGGGGDDLGAAEEAMAGAGAGAGAGSGADVRGGVPRLRPTLAASSSMCVLCAKVFAGTGGQARVAAVRIGQGLALQFAHCGLLVEVGSRVCATHVEELNAGRLALPVDGVRRKRAADGSRQRMFEEVSAEELVDFMQNTRMLSRIESARVEAVAGRASHAARVEELQAQVRRLEDENQLLRQGEEEEAGAGVGDTPALRVEHASVLCKAILDRSVSDVACRAFTGLSRGTLRLLISRVDESIDLANLPQQSRKKLRTSEVVVPQRPSAPNAPRRRMSSTEMVMVTLARLRLHLPVIALATMFGVSASYVSKIFLMVIGILHDKVVPRSLKYPAEALPECVLGHIDLELKSVSNHERANYYSPQAGKCVARIAVSVGLTGHIYAAVPGFGPAESPAEPVAALVPGAVPLSTRGTTILACHRPDTAGSATITVVEPDHPTVTRALAAAKSRLEAFAVVAPMPFAMYAEARDSIIGVVATLSNESQRAL